MTKATEAEKKVLKQIEKYLARCKSPPPVIHVYEKQAATVRASRQRHKGKALSTEFLEFTHFKGIPVATIEEVSND